jgi:hypothetical protein
MAVTIPLPHPPPTHIASQKTSCTLTRMMVDIDLLVEALRKRGHKVEGVFKVPDNAGDYELIVDGNTLNLAETRQLLEAEEPK